MAGARSTVKAGELITMSRRVKQSRRRRRRTWGSGHGCV